MYFQQYYLGCLAHASYLIGDRTTGAAVVVDPQRDVDQYLADAAAQGLTIRHVVLTHFHADFLAGHIELRNRTGARIYLGARAEAEFDFTPLSDGDAIELGRVRLVTLETPGHTPEGISLLVYDDDRSTGEPHAVLTGDTLFIGDVGRPDLLASLGMTADELADLLYDSLRTKLMPLPDATLVYPAHGAGSMCGKNLSDATVSTIGEQKRENYALWPMSRAEFKAIVTADQPEAPDYFAYDAIRNRQERPALEKTMSQALRGMPLDDVLQEASAGAQLVDVRDGVDFAAAHLRGSLNISLRGKYAPWAGALLDRERPILIVAEPGEEEEAVMRLGRIGFDNVRGYLADGMAALAARPEVVESTERLPVAELAEQLADPSRAAEGPLVVDVRAENEWRVAHIAGSVNIPLPQLRTRWRELPSDRRLVVHCEGGYRSAIAASLLLRHNLPVSDLIGGFKTWVTLRLPIETAEAPVG